MRHRIARLFALLLRRQTGPEGTVQETRPAVVLGIGIGSCGMPSVVVRGTK